MAASVDEVEVIIIKPDKMPYSWPGTVKIFLLILVAILFYIYIHIFVTAVLLKTRHLDRIKMLTIKTDKMMDHLFVVDQNISISLEDLSNIPFP